MRSKTDFPSLSMHIRELAGQKVCILGYGREGRAMLDAIEQHKILCDVTIADEKNVECRTVNVECRSGKDYLKNLDRFDVIIKSPGIPPIVFDNRPELRRRATSSTQIFLDTINDLTPPPYPPPSGEVPPRGEGKPLVIGITGSKGKSTTSSLIAHILKEAKKDVSLIGNIGDPAIAHLDEANPSKIFVMEMSSAQLMDLTVSPPIAVITSFFPEHLDYHDSLEAYKNAKTHIAKFQQKKDIIFFNAIFDDAAHIASLSPGKQIPFTSDDAPIAIIDTHLIGMHNLSNIAAAWKVVESLGVAKDQAIAAIQSFTPLPHRLQSIGVYHQIEWINDSIATNPNATMAAIDALGDRVQTLILGGQDRGFDYADLAARIRASHIQQVILLGETTPRIHKALLQAKFTGTISEVKMLKEAVLTASSFQLTCLEPIVLLSPAAPSYDMFKNFEERGKEFEQWVKKFPLPRGEG